MYKHLCTKVSATWTMLCVCILFQEDAFFSPIIRVPSISGIFKMQGAIISPVLILLRQLSLSALLALHWTHTLRKTDRRSTSSPASMVAQRACNGKFQYTRFIFLCGSF